MAYVNRETGKIVTYCPDFVEGMAEEWIEDDAEELLSFLNPPPAPQPITKRQLRLTLVRNDIPLAMVEAAIASMPEGLQKQEAQIEWADASTFNRNHPTLLLIASALGLGEAQVDVMWEQAVTA